MQKYELYTELQFNETPVTGMLPVKCSECSAAFTRLKSLLYFTRRKHIPHIFCSKDCKYKYIRKLKGITQGRCLQCSCDIIIYRSTKNKFCSQSCAAIYNNTGRVKVSRSNCLNCNNLCIDSRAKFCSITCSSEYRVKKSIIEWKAGRIVGHTNSLTCTIRGFVRKYLFKKYNNKCCKCGWSEFNTTSNKVPLEVNHIDGNAKNSIESNLELLCPNCHSLTSTYKALNKGKGSRCRFKAVSR